MAAVPIKIIRKRVHLSSRSLQQIDRPGYLRFDEETDRRFLFLAVERNSRLREQLVSLFAKSDKSIADRQRSKRVSRVSKNKEKGRATLLALKAVHLLFALLPSLPSSLPFRLFRTSILSARFPFFFPPPALSLRFASPQHGFLIGPIISRAIIIPKTNSYFLLRNRKLINQSSHWPESSDAAGES